MEQKKIPELEVMVQQLNNLKLKKILIKNNKMLKLLLKNKLQIIKQKELQL